MMKMTETELLRAAALRFREENLTEAGKRSPVPPSLERRVLRRIRRQKDGKNVPFKALALLAAAFLTAGVAALGLPILWGAVTKTPIADYAETEALPTQDSAPVNGIQDEPLTEEELILRLDQVTAALIEHGQLCDIRRDFLMKWQEGAAAIGWLTGRAPDAELPFDPGEVMAVYEKNESEGEPLPPLYRIARELNIRKEDFQAILAARKAEGGVIACTDEMIDRFYWPEDEAIRALKQPSALLSDGKVYSWSEIMTMRKEGTLFEHIPAQTVQEHIDTVIRYCDESGIVTLEDMTRCLTDPEPVSYYVLYDADAQTLFGTGGRGWPGSRYPEVFLTIPGPLMSYVGEEMSVWIEEMEKTAEEHPEEDRERYLNLYEFIRYFGIDRAVFEDLYYSEIYYAWDYPAEMIDVLYGGDEASVYAYFDGLELTGQESVMNARAALRMMKNRLRDEIGTERFEEQLGHDGQRIGTWSIAEAAYAFGLNAEELARLNEPELTVPPEEPPVEEQPVAVIEEVYKDGTTAEVYREGSANARYVFDFSVIERDRPEFEALIASGERPVLIDERIPCQTVQRP
ncbi:MAG: hypothetical protein E7576_16650 [Ruminococcaceae bacterium]|nr:hypothetical protein [Oscillospiraceae bacterium]